MNQFKVIFKTGNKEIEHTLKARWSDSMATELEKYHKVDTKKELINIISEMIRSELNSENFIENIIEELVDNIRNG